MELSLSDEQSSLLQEILSSALRDLRYEIADTDNHNYRADLKAREAMLREVLEKVGGLLEP